MAKKKKKSNNGTLKTVIVTAIIVALLCFFTPKLVHKCDNCGKFFVGTGYAPNILTGTFNEEEIICENCEEEEYVILGVRVSDKEDHKLPLIPSSHKSNDKKEE